MTMPVKVITVERPPFRPFSRLRRPAAFVLLVLSAIAASVSSSVGAGAKADARSVVRFVTAADMGAGSLLLGTTQDGRYIEAPLLGTDVDLTVSGPTARARVTQIFHNPTDGWVEAVYVHPMPEGGAVDTLKMVIGERIVLGEIKERQQARQIYQ